MSGSVVITERLSPVDRFADPRRVTKMVTSFQAGHGFTQSGVSGTVNLNDTTDFVLGTQSAWLQSDGGGVNATVLRATGLTATDFTGKDLRVWLKCDDWSKLSQFQLYMGDTTLANYTFPKVSDDLFSSEASLAVKSGEWGVLTIPASNWTTQAGSPNRSAVTDWQFRIVDRGTGPLKIHVNGIASVPSMASTYPNGVVSFWFDDALTSQYTTARPKLDQYGYAATASVIVSAVGAGGGMTLAQLQALEQENGWEVAAHAYTATNHNAGFDTLSSGLLDAELRLSKRWLIDNGFKGRDIFAYPLGQWSLATEDAVKKYYNVARLVNSSRTEAIPPQNPFRLNALGLGNTTVVGNVTAAIDKAFAGQGWLIIYAHDIVTSPSTGTQFSTANFGTVVDYCNTKGIPVRTVGDVMRGIA